MRRIRILGAALILGVLAGCAHGPSPGTNDAAEAARYTPRSFAAALLAETNRVRRAEGLRALRGAKALDDAADDQAAFMALRLSAEHLSALPGQTTPMDRAHRRGIEATRCAENVASIPVGHEGELPSVQAIAAELVQGWMDSPHHRANLLSPEFEYLGGSVRLAKGLGSANVAFGAQLFVRTPTGRLTTR